MGVVSDLEYHLLPGDPVAALNLLREAAGMEPFIQVPPEGHIEDLRPRS